MATIRNPINRSQVIDLLPTIENLVPAFGVIADSGLFTETPVKTNFAMYEIEEGSNMPMTKLTSRTERDSVRVGGAKSKHVVFGGKTIKIDDGVHVEDLQNVLTVFDIDQDQSLQQAIAKKTANMYNSWSQSYEYMLLTASQGRMRDPKDGAVAIDQFANTGTVQSTHTVDLRLTSTSVISDLNALRNKINKLNGFHGSIREIELVVADNVFDRIITHPELVTLYSAAFNTRGMEAVNNPIINGSADRPTLSRYGWRREFRWENILIVTYPQEFTHMNLSTSKAVADGKGWTIVRGATDSYEVLFAPAPYFSQLNGVGQKLYARSTGIVEDTHIDMTLESHLTPYLKRPELAVDVTFTLA